MRKIRWRRTTGIRRPSHLAFLILLSFTSVCSRSSRSWTSGFSRALSQDTLRPIPRPSALQYALLVAWQRLRKGVIRTQHASLLGTSGGQLAKVYQRRPSGQTTCRQPLCTCHVSGQLNLDTRIRQQATIFRGRRDVVDLQAVPDAIKQHVQ